MNWATERARAVMNSIGFSEDPEAAIAAALQEVVDECVEITETRVGPAKDIRAKFPKEGE